jgi:hypothetical protein
VRERGIRGIIEKREKQLDSDHKVRMAMAERLDAVRAFTNPDAKVMRFSETAKMPESAA